MEAMALCSKVLYNRRILQLKSALQEMEDLRPRVHRAEMRAAYYKHVDFFQWTYPKIDRARLLTMASEFGVRLCFLVDDNLRSAIPNEVHRPVYGPCCDDEIHLLVHEQISYDIMKVYGGRLFFQANTLEDQMPVYRFLHAVRNHDSGPHFAIPFEEFMDRDTG